MKRYGVVIVTSILVLAVLLVSGAVLEDAFKDKMKTKEVVGTQANLQVDEIEEDLVANQTYPDVIKIADTIGRNQLHINIDEPLLSESDLINASDLVAEVNIMNKVEGVADESVIIYEAKITDYTKGEPEKIINLVMLNAIIEPSNIDIKIGNSYFLYLYESAKYGENYYNLVSYAQGSCEIE